MPRRSGNQALKRLEPTAPVPAFLWLVQKKVAAQTPVKIKESGRPNTGRPFRQHFRPENHEVGESAAPGEVLIGIGDPESLQAASGHHGHSGAVTVFPGPCQVYAQIVACNGLVADPDLPRRT
jgi:hypothetical protein